MPRYIDADLLLTDEKTHTLPNGCGKASGNVVVFVDDIEKLPTADVVPKSEVEKEIKNWQELYADTVCKWEKAYEELEIKLENAKAEVAREIFARIDSMCIDLFGNFNHGRFIELKKKYTEGE